MFNRNRYFDEYFQQNAEPGESYHYYFYVVKLASFTKFLVFQGAANFLGSHTIVCVTNKRILICEMNQVTGNLTGATLEVNMDDVKNISLQKGFLKTKVKVTFPDDSYLVFKPNNICIGLSNHKLHLAKLKEMHG
ncbi:PH domain-containing protein [Paenibacillus sp. GCM10027627]|uniref:PH domain-containing protein n=1 Tax=unclassified Paenibacillus TaxID=185978 RepID=UPI003633A9A5